jgi:hypothetical protein
MMVVERIESLFTLQAKPESETALKTVHQTYTGRYSKGRTSRNHNKYGLRTHVGASTN